jgi:hypothetical protein
MNSASMLIYMAQSNNVTVPLSSKCLIWWKASVQRNAVKGIAYLASKDG